VVALTGAGDIVTGVLHGAVGRRQVVEEHEMLVGDDLPVGSADNRARVEIEVVARGGAKIPPQADFDRGEAGRFLAEADVATLGQAYCHDVLLTERVGSFVRSGYRAA